MYSTDLKQRVVDYRMGNHTIKETAEVFKIGTTTAKKWVKEFVSTGIVRSEYDSSNRTFKKINPTELKKYVEKHSDAFLKEIAARFSCGISSVRKALKKLKITRKKRPIYTRNEAKKNAVNI